LPRSTSSSTRTATGRSCGRRDTQHILGLAAHQQDLRQRHHHLGGRDPEPLRLGKGHLGGTEFTTA
jgi:hypothetical protein